MSSEYDYSAELASSESGICNQSQGFILLGASSSNCGATREWTSMWESSLQQAVDFLPKSSKYRSSTGINEVLQHSLHKRSRVSSHLGYAPYTSNTSRTRSPNLHQLVHIGGLLSQRTGIPFIIGLAPFRAHMCTVCGCMRDFIISINLPDSYVYDDLFQWMVGGRGEKICQIQFSAIVRVRRSRPSVGLVASKCTTLLKKWKLSIESQEQILCIKYNIVCTLAHDGPISCQQSQDTAKILVCPKHFWAFLHLTST